MRILNNISAINIYSQYGVSNRVPAKNVDGSGSGSRSGRSDLDAMGVVVSGKLRTNIHGLSDSSRRAQEDITSIQIADNALEKSQNTLQRMRTLAAQSAEFSGSDIDRVALDFEYTQFKFELDELGTVRFNGIDLLRTDAPVNLVFHSDSGSESVTINAPRSDDLGNIITASTAGQALNSLDNAINDVSSTRERLGSILGSLQDDYMAKSAGSVVRDADMARKTIDSVRSGILSQPAATAMAQANAMPMGTMRLVV